MDEGLDTIQQQTQEMDGFLWYLGTKTLDSNVGLQRDA
jgi:hypothetical protein